jgi:hypothetical protein
MSSNWPTSLHRELSVRNCGSACEFSDNSCSTTGSSSGTTTSMRGRPAEFSSVFFNVRRGNLRRNSLRFAQAASNRLSIPTEDRFCGSRTASGIGSASPSKPAGIFANAISHRWGTPERLGHSIPNSVIGFRGSQ